MTKYLLSKLPLSTYALIAFCASAVISVMLDAPLIEFCALALFLTFSVFLACLRHEFAVVFIALSIGIIASNYVLLSSSRTLADGCVETQIMSQAQKFKEGFIYKAKEKESFLIFSPKDELEIADKAKLCRKGLLELSKKDQHYFLARYKMKDVYNVENLEKLESGKSFFRSMAEASKKVREATGRIYTGDKSALAYGLLFGSTGDFSKEAKDDFKKSGTSHLVAVSGYNVSIITAWLFTSLRSISKNFAGVFSVIILLLFYFLTGGSMSVLRAAIMGSLILISRFIGRKVLPIHLLLLAASVIIVFNPYAIYDWGFQLSFMATAGLFFLSPALEQILSFGKIKSGFLKIFSETLGAQIFVLPILVGNFGQVSIIAPLTNLLIIPIVPMTMFFVALSLVGYFILHILGMFFGGISAVLLSYILSVIKISSSFKFASLSIKIEPVYAYLIGYALVIALTVFLRRKVAENK